MVGKTKIFIDGGDPQETKEAHDMLKSAGFGGLDGQTTNPSLIAKNAKKNVEKKGGGTLSQQEALAHYRTVVEEIASITKGPVSIQVIANEKTTAKEMLTQARDRLSWTTNPTIKFPCTYEGLKAAEIFCQEGPINMTLAFSQSQGAAVHAATKRHNYPVFISPFVGRLDDRGENGMDVVVNILELYKGMGGSHVEVLTASLRKVAHIQYALFLKSHIITIPFAILKEWGDQGFFQPGESFIYDTPGLTEIPYRAMTLDKDWVQYNIKHDLTDSGVVKFWEDWTGIVSK